MVSFNQGFQLYFGGLKRRVKAGGQENEVSVSRATGFEGAAAARIKDDKIQHGDDPDRIGGEGLAGGKKGDLASNENLFI